MSLQEIKNLKDQKGFTIVELLIVIVVIGILAAIVIVAFNGVQARANTTAAKSAASTVQKKAEAYNSVNTAYPTSLAQFDAEAESKLTGSGVALAASGGVNGSNGKTTVLYSTCSTGGYRVQFWDYTLSTPGLSAAADTLYGGGASSSSSCTWTIRS